MIEHITCAEVVDMMVTMNPNIHNLMETFYKKKQGWNVHNKKNGAALVDSHNLEPAQ